MYLIINITVNQKRLPKHLLSFLFEEQGKKIRGAKGDKMLNATVMVTMFVS